jgi:iron(III) transport system ATP-binding protein
MLQLIDIHFAFAKAETLKNISFTLEKGRHLALLGESGCGKSTLLDIIYGVLQAQKGRVEWNGEELLGADNHLIPGHPMMKYVPQEFDLMPFTTVFENVGEHLSIQNDDRSRRIMELLDVVDMESFKDRKVKTLSGGQKQRVAIAKALAQEPQLLLLDEPFSHIDNSRKNNLRRRLFSYLRQNNISAIVATHDKDDVLSFCHETIILRDGEIVDHRTTRAAYEQPRHLYAASLFDEVSLIPREWTDASEDVIAYPHQIEVSESGFEVVIKESFFTGRDYLICAVRGDRELFFRYPDPFEHGEKVTVRLSNY